MTPADSYPARPYAIATTLILCCIMAYILVLNARTPSFVYSELGVLYNDAHYIASVAKNLLAGHGVSYWNGFEYRFMDPEISSGPTVFLPLAVVLWAGVDEWHAFHTAPLFINLTLFAWLLMRMSRHQPLASFICAATATATISLFFQRWQWYLPLGETPAALCLLLSAVYLAPTGSNQLTTGRYAVSGILWMCAVFSKMMVVLTLPIFVLFIALSPLRNNIAKRWLTGAGTTFVAYMLFCLATMPDPNLTGLLHALHEYVQFNFRFGISNPITVDAAERDLLEVISSHLHYNITALPTIADNIGYIKSFLLIAAGLAGTLISHMYGTTALPTACLAFGTSGIVMFWYFFLGQHGSRYFFIPGYLSIWSLLFASVMPTFRGKVLGPGLNIALIIIFLSLSRHIIFPPKGDFSKIGDMKALASYVAENNIPEFMGNMTLFHGYPEIAYYLDSENRYLIITGYLEKHATLVDEGFCRNFATRSFDDYINEKKLSSCLLFSDANQTDPAVFTWKDNQPGYFLRKIPKDRAPSQQMECSKVLFRNPHYILQQCSKQELTNVIQRRLLGRVRFQ